MIIEFFIWCSGANKDILKKCPTERTKFAGIGATIFLTAILASISGGYAIYFTFNSIAIAIAMGIFWGFVIFNLDRYIVSSMRKTGNTRQEARIALPRILIALVLAVTISKPLETKLFGATIQKKMAQTEDMYNANCEKDFNNRRDLLDEKKRVLETERETAKNAIFNNDPVVSDLNSRVAGNNSFIQTAGNTMNANRKIIEKNSWLETTISRKTGEPIKVWRRNAEAKRAISANAQLEKDIQSTKNAIAALNDSNNSRRTAMAAQVRTTESQYNDQIQGIKQQIDDLNAQRSSIIQKCRMDAGGNKDILDRLKALGELKSFGNTVWFASWLITLIFMLLETAPVIVKLLTSRGPYDELLEITEAKVKQDEEHEQVKKLAELDTEKKELNTRMQQESEFRLTIDRERLNAELMANKDLLAKIAAKQAKFTEEIVDNWYREQKQKMASFSQPGTPESLGSN